MFLGVFLVIIFTSAVQMYDTYSGIAARKKKRIEEMKEIDIATK